MPQEKRLFSSDSEGEQDYKVMNNPRDSLFN